MTQNQPKQSYGFKYRKIHFKIFRKVQFGQAVYVCGNIPELGRWSISKAHRLKWNEGHTWSGSILVTSGDVVDVQYKYIIADWCLPTPLLTLWEVGKHNRKLKLDKPESKILCDDRWNMDMVTLILITPKCSTGKNTKYYVTGNIMELGNYRQKKALLARRKISFESMVQNDDQNQLFSHSFYTYREKEQFTYYYIRKTAVLQKERHPGRVFSFKKQQQVHPNRHCVVNPKGDIVIFDKCNISSIVFSQVTPRILVGNYPRTFSDVKTLKQNNVTAVLSIQSDRDFQRHGITPQFAKLVSEQSGIKYKRFAIEDMDPVDFVQKAVGGIQVLREWLGGGQRVYVHCSAGIYRSPQMIALYLTYFENLTVSEAVQILKKQHPYAKPSCKIIEDTLVTLKKKIKN